MSSSILLITGGNTGLGFLTALALWRSSKPYSILLGCRALSKGEEAVKAIKSERPGDPSTAITSVQIDIENDDSIDALYSLVETRHGRLDVLINNAGMAFVNFA